MKDSILEGAAHVKDAVVDTVSDGVKTGAKLASDGIKVGAKVATDTAKTAGKSHDLFRESSIDLSLVQASTCPMLLRRLRKSVKKRRLMRLKQQRSMLLPVLRRLKKHLMTM